MPGEPTALISPCSAGAVEFRATLSWDGPEDAPEGPLPGLPDPFRTEAARVRIGEEADAGRGVRRVSGEIRALRRPELGRALEAVLRAITAAAGLTEAILEVETFRPVAPGVASAPALGALARDLWRAGYPVRFAPSWTPVADATVDVAVGSGDGELEAFFLSNPRWEPVGDVARGTRLGTRVGTRGVA